MSIETQRKTTIQMIWLKSDMFMESDEGDVKKIVEQALHIGLRKFLFSVSVFSLSNLAVITRLLLWCIETVRKNNGQLFFFERGMGEECVFGSLCESLQVPMYRNRFTAPKTTFKAAPLQSTHVPVN
jgi:hypothetical protein